MSPGGIYRQLAADGRTINIFSLTAFLLFFPDKGKGKKNGTQINSRYPPQINEMQCHVVRMTKKHSWKRIALLKSMVITARNKMGLNKYQSSKMSPYEFWEHKRTEKISGGVL